MGGYRIETVMENELTSFYVHRITERETQWVASCNELIWAKRMIQALEWLDTLEDGKMSLPRPRVSRAKKPVARKCAKKRS